MIKPVALLYSNDGFDPCELSNIRSLYERLNFEVRTCVKGRFEPCNVLVVVRGPDLNVPRLPEGLPVHVFNYVAYSMKAVISKVSQNPFVMIAPSPTILADHGIAKEMGVVALPPVYPDKWMVAGRAKKKFSSIHIGNRKVNSGATGDRYATALDFAVRQGGVDVWGNGWQGSAPADKHHGPIPITLVPQVYAQSRREVGLMYPFQRTSGTFSSRFWLAPLNGCALISEPTDWAGRIPGVYGVDYSEIDLLDCTLHGICEESADLRSPAVDYWREKTLDLERRIEAILAIAPPSSNAVRRHVLTAGLAACYWAAKIIVDEARCHRYGVREFLRGVGEPTDSAE